jgi:hypothetical protein
MLARALLAIGYVAAALFWLRASRRDRLATNGAFSRWWLVGAVLLILLAINKQFNLRGHFEEGFRALARAGNWYDRREPMQFIVAIVLPLVLALLAGIVLATNARAFFRSHRMALIGWLALLLYLALRQTQEWKPMRPLLEVLRYRDWRLALEVAGMLLVNAAAILACPPLRSHGSRVREGERPGGP